MKVDDILLGRLNLTISDGTLHDALVKMGSARKDLINEMKQNLSLDNLEKSTKFEITKNTTFISWVKSAFESFGIIINDGIVSIKEIVVDKITAKTIVIDNLEANKARLKKLEMVDSATGEIYCTWIENGEWKKIKGECVDNLVIVEPTVSPEPTFIPTPEPSANPEPTTNPEPTIGPEPTASPEPSVSPDPLTSPAVEPAVPENPEPVVSPVLQEPSAPSEPSVPTEPASGPVSVSD